ncbi:alpha/beta hydrolase [Halobellus salinus]|uniref:Alpha/beta hydrolase n=1 Tax=Halobellus salinus TaxID=931585 RepID=A0A830EQ56_9EURY|nr:alpha/beta hydrolase [Halobellus salinus]GGJ06211.1 alpha/beta hydrolase [Halobellus salinus]SMP14447.1 hypothetical protein SAMN06265347_10517 [Halobellus salinus]
MSDPIFLPGGRGARGTLDTAAEGAGSRSAGADGSTADACVVACPPHPDHGGHRGDRLLRAVAAELNATDTDCLRFDYGPWDGGRGERADASAAVEWADRRYERVAVFGYSFGGAVAIAAAAHGADVVAVAALAPPARAGAAGETAAGDVRGIDTVAALVAIPTSLCVGILYGSRDDTADVGPVVDCAHERGAVVRAFDADHFFVGHDAEVAAATVDFLGPSLHPDSRR